MSRWGDPTVELRDLPASVEHAIKKGIAEFTDEGETAIPIGLEDASGDRFGLLTDDEARERHLRVTRITIVVEPVGMPA